MSVTHPSRDPFGLTVDEMATCAAAARKVKGLPYHLALAFEMERCLVESGRKADPWTSLFTDHYAHLKAHSDALVDALAEVVDRAAMAGMDVDEFAEPLNAYLACFPLN